MKLLVITQSRNRAGRTVQVKKEVNVDWIRVGRAASSEVLLADPRVALNQGLIIDRNGPVYTEGEMGNMASTTRRAVRSVRLKPGASVDVGPYRLTAIQAPEGFTGAITVELVRPSEEVASEFLTRASRLTLASLRLPKRWAALALFALVAVVFFLLPAGRVFDLPWKQADTVAIASDKFWNPGPVMLAHQPIELKCESCHEVAFQHVRDGACLECHQKIGHHVGQDLKPAVLFEGMRCAQCHRDHKGIKTTFRDDDRFCVACHSDIGSKASGTEAKNVSDFAKEHPAFRLTIPVDKGVKRIRQGAGPIEESSNLVFPHATHLDPKGVKHPDKGRIKLECKACHTPDASARTFEPISMKRHCQDCHRLAFEPAVTTRQVPHGSAEEAMTVVREFYANLALNGVKDSFEKAFGVPGEGLLRRVGEPSQAQRQAALSMASQKAAKVSEELFAKKAKVADELAEKSAKVSKELLDVRVCSTCHQIVKSEGPDGPEWSVLKVRLNNRWMPHARFDHKSHAQSKCADCHDVAKSKRSADVAMPKIEDCRKCHAGSHPVEKKITSNCLLCHGFHEQKHPWDPAFKPKATTRVAQGAGGGN